MKRKLFIFFLFATLLFTLGGCVLSDGDLNKTNSTWYAEINGYEKLFFETQGPNSNYGFGYLVINGVKTDEMFVEFNTTKKTVTFYPIIESENKYPKAFATFKLERSRKHLLLPFVKHSDKAILTLDGSSLGDTFFDDKVYIYRDKVDSSPLEARNFKGVKWVNDEHKITISDYRYNTTRIFKGERVINLVKKDKFDFHFKEGFRFEIYEENTLVASGSYTCGNDHMELTFELNNIFPDLSRLDLKAKKI